MSEKKPTKYMIQEDCFAINHNLTDCRCLSKLYCKNCDCNFYKSKDELDWQNIEYEIRMYDNRKLKK